MQDYPEREANGAVCPRPPGGRGPALQGSHVANT